MNTCIHSVYIDSIYRAVGAATATPAMAVEVFFLHTHIIIARIRKLWVWPISPSSALVLKRLQL